MSNVNMRPYSIFVLIPYNFGALMVQITNHAINGFYESLGKVWKS
jgi:hypothetical protein